MTNQKLSPAKFTLLGFQHMFAMFGATVLVPTLTGLSVSATLLFAGLGTLLFHLITGGKVPAFLGSSFAFLGGYAAVKAMPQFADGTMNWIPYAGVGVAVAGLIYVVVAGLFKIFGAQKVMSTRIRSRNRTKRWVFRYRSIFGYFVQNWLYTTCWLLKSVLFR